MTTQTYPSLVAYEAGKQELREILKMSTAEFDALKGRAQYFLDAGEDEKALEILTMLAALDRKDKTLALVMVETFLRLGSSGQAELVVDKLLEHDPHDAEALVAKAQVHIAAGELVPAAGLLQEVVGRDPENRLVVTRRAYAVAQEAYRQTS